MSPPATSAWGLYVHVPWCRRRCPYCAFYVEVDRDTPWERFADRVIAEHAARAAAFPGPAATVFLGGGTPSRLPPGTLARLLAALPHAPDAEITAETNPEDVDDAWLAGARAAGVTRLSVGVQTFDPRFAHLLNRACTVDRAAEVVGAVARAGFTSWSLDLMFGLPGQTLADLDADLDRVLAPDPPHVSLYGLTIEPGTPFERGVARGSLVPADADLWRAMYDHLVARLRAAGLERYEVSNFARDGHRSRHNRLYWSDAPYLGLGPSAHGYLPDGARYHNVADVARYLVDPDPTAESERPSPRERALDLLVSMLRRVEGVPIAHLEARTGLSPDPKLRAAFVRQGLLADDPDALVLADAGFPLADGLARRLWDTLRPVAG